VSETVWGLLGYVALVCVWVYFCCFSVGLSKVGVVGWSEVLSVQEGGVV
jgi:hypothetical protein